MGPKKWGNIIANSGKWRCFQHVPNCVGNVTIQSSIVAVSSFRLAPKFLRGPNCFGKRFKSEQNLNSSECVQSTLQNMLLYIYIFAMLQHRF